MNGKRLFVLAVLVVVLFAGTAAAEQTHYRFNETSGTDVQDYSGNGFTGTRTGATQGAAGISKGTGDWGDGLAYLFDGTDDYVTTPDRSAFNYGSETSFTLMAWFNTTTSATQRIFSSNESTTRNQDILMRVASSGELEGAIKDDTGTHNFISSTATVDDGNYHHGAVVYDAGADNLSLYLDGSLAASTTTTSNGIGESIAWRIGGYRSTGTEMFDGNIDEPHIFNESLTTAQIESFYTDNTQNTPPTVENVTTTPDPVTAGDDVNVSADISDPDGDTIKWAGASVWEDGTKTQTNVTQSSISGNEYSWTDLITNAEDGTTYTVQIEASDGSVTGATNTTFTPQDNTPPKWRNLGDNATDPVEQGKTVEIFAEFKDDGTYLNDTILSVNETGTFANETDNEQFIVTGWTGTAVDNDLFLISDLAQQGQYSGVITEPTTSVNKNLSSTQTPNEIRWWSRMEDATDYSTYRFEAEDDQPITTIEFANGGVFYRSGGSNTIYTGTNDGVWYEVRLYNIDYSSKTFDAEVLSTSGNVLGSVSGASFQGSAENFTSLEITNDNQNNNSVYTDDIRYDGTTFDDFEGWIKSAHTWKNPSFTGTLAYKIYGGDASGNYNVTDTGTFTVQELPDITIHSPENKTYQEGTDIDLDVSSTKTMDTWIYNLDGQGNNTFVPNTTTFTGLGPSPHTVEVWSNDTSGNWDYAERQFTVVTPPDPQADDPADNAMYNVAQGGTVSIPFNWTVDAGNLSGTTNLVVDGSTVNTQNFNADNVQTFTSTQSYGTGTYDWYVTADDGETGEKTSVTRSFTVSEAELANITLDSPTSGKTFEVDSQSDNASVTLEWTVSGGDEPGDTTVYIDGNAKSTQSYNAGQTETFTYTTSLGTGTYSWKADATDDLGQTNTTNQRTFRISTAPFYDVNLTAPNDTAEFNFTTERNLTFNYTVEGNRDGTVRLVVDTPRSGERTVSTNTFSTTAGQVATVDYSTTYMVPERGKYSWYVNVTGSETTTESETRSFRYPFEREFTGLVGLIIRGAADELQSAFGSTRDRATTGVGLLLAILLTNISGVAFGRRLNDNNGEGFAWIYTFSFVASLLISTMLNLIPVYVFVTLTVVTVAGVTLTQRRTR